MAEYANQITEKYENLFREGSRIRQDLEDKFSDGLDAVANRFFDMDAKGVAEDPSSLAKVATGAIVYNALSNEGEEGLAEEFLEAYKLRLEGDGKADAMYFEVLEKVKDTQILQSKYGITNVLDVEKTLDALAGTGKLTKKVAENQVTQYAAQRVSSDIAQLMSLAAEGGQYSVDPLNDQLAHYAGEMGIAYNPAESVTELPSKGVGLFQNKQQIDQSLEGRVV